MTEDNPFFNQGFLKSCMLTCNLRVWSLEPDRLSLSRPLLSQYYAIFIPGSLQTGLSWLSSNHKLSWFLLRSINVSRLILVKKSKCGSCNQNLTVVNEEPFTQASQRSVNVYQSSLTLLHWFCTWGLLNWTWVKPEPTDLSRLCTSFQAVHLLVNSQRGRA